MWALSLVMLSALALNIILRDSGEVFRPLHIVLCGPLALYCAVAGWLKWQVD